MNVTMEKNLLTPYVEADITVVEAFRRTLAQNTGTGMVHVAGDGSENFENYHMMLSRAERVLTGLRLAGLKPGDNLLMQTDKSDEFVAVFWACLLGGIVPVPLSVPASYRAEDQEFRKFHNVYTLLGHPLVACDGELARELHGLSEARIPELRHVTVADLAAHEPADEFHHARPDDLAFLMFSSGSTGTPKGVCLSHRNLLHNMHQIAERSALTPDDVSVSWLPYTHDMGLILFHLTHALCGITQVKMSNFTFIRRPELYLQKLHNYKATLTGCPNFALHHLLTQVDEAVTAEIDLSRLRLIYNGAEPISADICRAFLARYCPETNLPQTAISPGYGIAEACVTATQHPWGSAPALEACPSLLVDRATFLEQQRAVAPIGDAPHMEIVDLGPPMPGMQARIVDHDHRPLGDLAVGRIQFKGPNITSGYYNNPAANEALFVDGWLDTGDLGFLRDGNVYITGRAKDIIFINGQNFYSHDLEDVVAAHTEFELGQVAVVGYSDPDGRGERIAAFIVTRKKGDALVQQAAAVREALAGRFKFDVDEVVPIRRMPRTTSGKIQRYLLRDQFLAGAYRDVCAKLQAMIDAGEKVGPRNTCEERLYGIMCGELGFAPGTVGVTDNLLSLGADSIKILRFANAVNQAFSLRLAVKDIYAAPTVAGVAELVTRRAGDAGGLVLPEIVATGKNIYPLSAAQEQMWFLYLMDPESTYYNETHSMRIDAALDEARFGQAWTRVVAQNETLRTVFALEGDRAVQRILDRVDTTLNLVDLRGEADPAAALDAHLAQAAARAFNLETGPLFDLRLYRLDAETYHFFLNMHHIITDAWSFGNLIEDLYQTYHALVHNRELPPGHRIRYGDFALWQNRLLEKGSFAADKTYWTERLKDRTPLQLPGDLPGTGVDNSGADLRLVIDPDRLETLQDLGRERGLNLFQTLMGAYYLVLNRLTDADDLTVGTVVSGRGQADLKRLVGCFVNTVPMSFHLDGRETVAAFLDRLRAECVDTLEHQDYPYHLIKEASGRADDLFSTVLVMQNTPISFRYPDMSLSDIRHYRGGSKVDLYLTAREIEGSLRIDCRYNDTRFSRATVQAWINSLSRALDLLAADQSVAVADLDVLGEDQLAAVRAYNHTEAPYDLSVPVHTLFARAAAANPERTAVSDGAHGLTYGELEARANQIAHVLGAEARGRFVAVMMDRGTHWLPAILGVLKAGAAYLPVDPSFPDARVVDMLGQAEVDTLISREALADKVDRLTLVAGLKRVVSLDGILAPADTVCIGPDRIQAAPVTDPEVAVDADDAAYVIFTSGSTGRPKGVVNSHRAVANMVHWVVDAFRYRAGQRMCQFAPFSFDVSVGEMFPALSAGLTIYVLGEDDRRSPEAYLNFLEAARINIATLTPAFFYQVNQWIADFGNHRLGDLDLFIFGGEALRLDQVLAFRKRIPHTRLINVYGPTETTVLSSWYAVDETVDTTRPVVVLGRPIANTSFYILDTHARLCPIGVVGEICIGGAGLTKGYLQDAEKTAAAFRTLHVDGEDRLLYTSGDLARLLPDGTVEFVGRKDSQVKLRGYRIETAEVEAALKSFPGVTEAVVKVVTRGEGNKVLVGWYAGDDVSRGALQHHLEDRLPGYMVPGFLVAVDGFKLTANNKVDRRNLPEPDFSRRTDAAGYEAPAGEVEEALAGFWQTLLGLDKVGATDNFFDLGGDSLTAARLYALIKERFGDGLSLRPLLEDAVLRKQAAYVAANARGASAGAGIPRLPAADAYPLSAAQQRLVYLQALNPQSAAYNIPVHLEISGPLDPERLHRALQAVVDLHPGLRTRFIERDGTTLQEILPHLTVALPVTDLSDDPERDRRKGELAFELLTGAFDLGTAPLLRAAVVKLSDTAYTFSLVIHHAVADGRSLEVVLGQIREAYAAFSAGRTPALTAPARIYPDYAVWQNEGLRRGDFAASAAFWKNELAGRLPVLRLPYDHRPPQQNDFRGVQETAVFPLALLKKLDALKTNRKLTRFSTLLGLFQVFLGRETGADDLAVGISVGARTHTETQDVVGLFVNTVPVRAALSTDTSVEAFLDDTQQRLNRIQDHQDYPLNEIVKCADLGPEHRRSPLFNVLFNTETVPMEMTLGEATLRMAGVNTGTAKFDMVVSYAVVPEGLWFRFEYNSLLFEAATVDGLIQRFQALLEQLADDPSQPVLEAPEEAPDALMALLNAIEAKA